MAKMKKATSKPVRPIYGAVTLATDGQPGEHEYLIVRRDELGGRIMVPHQKAAEQGPSTKQQPENQAATQTLS